MGRRSRYITVYGSSIDPAQLTQDAQMPLPRRKVLLDRTHHLSTPAQDETRMTMTTTDMKARVLWTMTTTIDLLLVSAVVEEGARASANAGLLLAGCVPKQ